MGVVTSDYCSASVPSDEEAAEKPETAQLNDELLKILVNTKLFALQSTTLKAILEKLKAENLRKRQLLDALEKGKKKDKILELSKETSEKLPCFPCKLNDLRFYIENLSSGVTEDDLMDHFEEFGEILDLRIDANKKAFIAFAYFHNARPGKDHKIKETSFVLEAVYKYSDEESTTVAITGNIDELSGDLLRKYISSFGVIIDYRRSVNRKTRKLSRFIFVKFQKVETVEKILNAKPHRIRNRCEKFDFEIMKVNSF